jgi:mono/diheme cytochrome c family protein
MKLALLTLAFWLAASTGLRAEPQGMGDPQEGFEYAKEVCANCHAILSNETSPVREAPTFDEIAKQSQRSAATIIKRTEAVHPTMPNIPMKRDELNDLAAYILSLDGEEPANSP